MSGQSVLSCTHRERASSLGFMFEYMGQVPLPNLTPDTNRYLEILHC